MSKFLPAGGSCSSGCRSLIWDSSGPHLQPGRAWKRSQALMPSGRKQPEPVLPLPPGMGPGLSRLSDHTCDVWGEQQLEREDFLFPEEGSNGGRKDRHALAGTLACRSLGAATSLVPSLHRARVSKGNSGLALCTSPRSVAPHRESSTATLP